MELTRTRRFLNLRIGPKSGIHTRIIECPGLWMREDESAQLVKDMRQVVRSIAIDDLDYGIFTGEKEALERGVITLIYDGEKQRPLAFNSMAYIPCEIRGEATPVLHLGLTIVDPSVQTRGFTWTLYGLSISLILLRNQLRPFWISNVTQVPAVFGKVADNFSNVYPTGQANQHQSFSHLHLARQIMREHRHVFGVSPDSPFDEQSFIIKDSYTGGSDHLKKTFAACTKYRDERVNNFCEQQLDYSRGDDFLQLGQANLQVMFQFVFRVIPANAIFSLSAKFAYIALESLLVPILGWLCTSQTYKELRPRRGTAK